MAVKLTVSEFYDDLDNLTNNKFSGVNASQKLRYLNRAILDKFNEIKTHCRQATDASAMITSGTVDSQDIDLPDDIDLSADAQILLFRDETRQDGVSNDEYYIFGGKIRFAYAQAANTNYWIEYVKEPSRYSKIDLSESIVETADIRTLEILQTQVEYIRDSDVVQGQISAKAQSAKLKTNEIS